MRQEDWNTVTRIGQWGKLWCQNCSGERLKSVAVGLLHTLPDLAVLPKGSQGCVDEDHWFADDPGVGEGFTDGLTALDFAIYWVMNEQDRDIAIEALRAVYLIIDRMLMPFLRVHRPPHVRAGTWGDNHWKAGVTLWDSPLYRAIPTTLLRFFSHPRCYAPKMKHYLGIQFQAVFCLGCWYRPISPDSTGMFSYPFSDEQGRVDLLRAHVIEPRVMYPHSMPPDYKPLFFELLTDARDSYLWARPQGQYREVVYSREPQHPWPCFTDEHYGKIVDRIYHLGVELEKRKEEIQPGKYVKT